MSAGVKIVLEAVCILKNIKAIRVKDAASGKMVDDYWEASKKMLMESDFLQSLRDFDRDNIPAKIIEKIKPYVNNPEFEPSKILQASKAAYGLCCWVRAMEAYDRVAKVVGPKKQKLGEAEQELEVTTANLGALFHLLLETIFTMCMSAVPGCNECTENQASRTPGGVGQACSPRCRSD